MSVQFEEEESMSRAPMSYQRASGAAASEKKKALLAASAIIILALALVIWLKFGDTTRPPVSDTRPTPAASSASL